jgi:hypothetical protein
MPSKATMSETERRRLPYEPPAIEETSEFETLALDCGHTEGGGPACTFDPQYGFNGEPSSG